MLTVKEQLKEFLFWRGWTPKWEIENFAGQIKTKKGAILKDNVDRRMRELCHDNPNLIQRKIVDGIVYYRM